MISNYPQSVKNKIFARILFEKDKKSVYLHAKMKRHENAFHFYRKNRLTLKQLKFSIIL